jgi:hypothetical protein
VAGAEWFAKSMATRNGGEFTVADVCSMESLADAQVATYATAIRENGDEDGSPIGTLAIFFDWEPQARAVVEGVRLSADEKSTTRCLLTDASGRIIAAAIRYAVMAR